MKLSLPFLILLVSVSAKAQLTDEQQIKDARQRHNRAIAQHDTFAIADVWTTDFHVISSRNMESRSSEQNRQFLTSEFKTKKGVVYVRTTKTIEIFSSWKMASEAGTWTGEWQEPDGLVKLFGTYYAKWHKINGQWKIRAEIFTPLGCSGSKFCDVPPKLE